jgi:hypothetical protein
MDWVRALYVAVALTFSSTIIIVKLLSDKREIDSLHGRIAMGFLIVQDIAVVLAMMVIGSQGAGGGGAEQDGWLAAAGQHLLKLAAVGVGVAALMRWVLPRCCTGWRPRRSCCWSSPWPGARRWRRAASGWVSARKSAPSSPASRWPRCRSARRSTRAWPACATSCCCSSSCTWAPSWTWDAGREMPAALVLSLFVLIGNPLIVMAIMGYMGYRKRTGFLAGLTVAQISEFSIIFVAMGWRWGTSIRRRWAGDAGRGWSRSP